MHKRLVLQLWKCGVSLVKFLVFIYFVSRQFIEYSTTLIIISLSLFIDCHVNHYTGFWWEDVEELNVSQYYEILGWNEYSWDNDVLPATDSLNWYQLTSVEQEAAKQLCYNRELWDGIPLPDWEDQEEAFIAKRSDVIAPLDAVVTTQPPSIQPSRIPTKQPSLSPVSESPSRQPSESPVEPVSTPQPTEAITSLSPTVLSEATLPEDTLSINPATLTKPEKRYVEWALLDDFDRRHARELLYIESVSYFVYFEIHICR